jgi:hypothetical protein
VFAILVRLRGINALNGFGDLAQVAGAEAGAAAVDSERSLGQDVGGSGCTQYRQAAEGDGRGQDEMHKL